MAAAYQLLNDTPTVLRRADNAYIPDDPANRDRAEYSEWLAQGNVPDPAPEPPAPPAPEPLELPPVMPVDPNDAAPKVYVDTEIATLKADAIRPLTERVEALEARMSSLERKVR